MNKTILSTNKLGKSFGSGTQQQHVLKDLDVKIYEGDFTVIMGASGAGKSTLLYALSGMDKPTTGEINFSGKEISKLSNDKLAIFRRDNCGFVFQQMFLLDNMSVIDNILASGLLVSNNRKKLTDSAEKLLNSVGISKDDFNKTPPQLSGGEAQRVAIVRALINKPKLVFADEPTGALNSNSTEAVLNVLTQINQAGQSIVMVTHDFNSAIRANRVLYLHDGVIQGVCDLGAYRETDGSRREYLTNFLQDMGW